jgi:hypothetical protein
MKICSICRKSKPLSEFHADNRARGERSPRGGKGVGQECKICLAEKRSPGITEARRARDELRSRGLKTCGMCKQIKLVTDFHVRRASNDGLAYKCVECVNNAVRDWRENNPGAFKLWYSENRERRAEYWADWYAENVDSRSKSYREWAKKNRDKINALIAKRIAAKKHALPTWANLEVIEAIYAEAARLTRETGIRHEVDHIYPLRGKLVCGLHCEANLQILTKVENIRKSNRMPDEVKQRGASGAFVNRTRRYSGNHQGDSAGIS